MQTLNIGTDYLVLNKIRFSYPLTELLVIYEVKKKYLNTTSEIICNPNPSDRYTLEPQDTGKYS